ncbi:1-(5-phosphoribosyl)-5-[(5-phosphoribosylamino)methylideneamino]imidazole-4-carboxamide isomerase [Dehalococcoidia bacterium]|nr:1-(5-phosphoribosyl)-5-[(5-phosphoribosylamino)methylideneamino]imidazole-4-carboxamide isomerase [Dehalococcoidia bacterium]
MEVIPAIDLRGGKCVRLFQGDFKRETVFSGDPAQVARDWVGHGATRLHVVDLDGARTGELTNLNVVRQIVDAVDVPVQLGGGIRTHAAATEVMHTGVARLMLGTVAVEQPELVNRLCYELGPLSVVATVDARDGLVAVSGWTSDSKLPVAEVVRRMKDVGVQSFLYTDIARDGTLTEPNFDGVADIVREAGDNVMAAGGISTIEHLSRLADLGVVGAVVGKALYTGDITLVEAMESLVGRA